MYMPCIPMQIKPNKSSFRNRLKAFLLWEISYLSSPSRSCLGRIILINGGWWSPAGGVHPHAYSHSSSNRHRAIFEEGHSNKQLEAQHTEAKDEHITGKRDPKGVWTEQLTVFAPVYHGYCTASPSPVSCLYHQSGSDHAIKECSLRQHLLPQLSSLTQRSWLDFFYKSIATIIIHIALKNSYYPYNSRAKSKYPIN